MYTLVTCYYDDLSETHLGGRRNRGSRYLTSLKSLSIHNSESNIMCFSFGKSLIELNQFIEREHLKNIKVLEFDLTTYKYHKQIQNVKQHLTDENEKYVYKERCLEMMWGKTHMIEQSISILNLGENENIFWIDAGILHYDIMQSKYSAGLAKDYSYIDCSALNTNFFSNLIKNANGKIFVALHTNPNNKPLASNYSTATQGSDGVVGGLLGGKVALMKRMLIQFDVKAELILQDNKICIEESILSTIFYENPDWFYHKKFQTWYHSEFVNHFSHELTPFSKAIIDELQGYEQIVFCNLSYGEKYNKQCLKLVESVNANMGNVKFIILTDDVEFYKKANITNQNIIVKAIKLPITKNFFPFNAKLFAIKEAYKSFNPDCIVYLDSDILLEDRVNENLFLNFKTGLNVFPNEQSKDNINNKIVLEKINRILKDEERIYFFKEQFLIFKTGAQKPFNEFLNQWEALYDYEVENGLCQHWESFEMSIASQRSGYPINDLSLEQNRFKEFEHIQRNFTTDIANTRGLALI